MLSRTLPWKSRREMMVTAKAGTMELPPGGFQPSRIPADLYGVDQSFALVALELDVVTDLHVADFSHLGAHQFCNREMLRPGAGLCVIFHQSALDARTKD